MKKYVLLFLSILALGALLLTAVGCGNSSENGGESTTPSEIGEPGDTATDSSGEKHLTDGTGEDSDPDRTGEETGIDSATEEDGTVESTEDESSKEGSDTTHDDTEGKALADQYEWGSVPMGAGGFVTGLVIHPTEPDLVYIRTDVGGCYRWDEETKTWTQLMDMFTRAEDSLYGVDGFALDANDPDVIYACCGSGGGSLFDVMKSTDRGKSWSKTGLASAMSAKLSHSGYGFDGNGTYRGSGERIAVDPANGNIIYVGTYKGGLWKSTDGGKKWTMVTLPNLPNNGNGYDARNVFFDTSTSVKGDKTMTIYVGVIGNGVCRSTDGGATWQKLDGAPQSVNRMSMGSNGILYAAAMNGLFKFQNNTWTDISPIKSKEYGGVSVNTLNDNELVCSVPQPIDNSAIWYSSDGGKTWIEKYHTSTINSDLAWNTSPTINSNGHCIVMDWNKQGRVWNTDWFCATRTDDITDATSHKWDYLYHGIEEIVPRNLTCPPSGTNRLYISVADNRGFPYSDYTKYPTTQLADWSRWYQDQAPGMMSISDTVYCEEDPNFVAIAGVNWNFYGKVELSTDGGKTWKTVKGLPSYVDDQGQILLDSNNCNEQIQYGAIAMSSEKQGNGYPVIILAPTYEQDGKTDHKGRTRHIPAGYETKPLLVSMDWGATWEKVDLPAGSEQIMRNHWHGNLPITADKVAGNRFYIIGQQQVYYSSDWGMTWTAGGRISDGWNYPQNEIKAAPYIEGEVWATMGVGLYRSSDGGKSFTKINGMWETVGFGFGKNAPGLDNPTVYVYGVYNGKEGIFRSTDMGKTFEMINNPGIMIGRSPNIVEGDMQEFGIVYITSGGRGVYYGRDTSVVPEEKTEYYSDFSGNSSTADWSFYLNGTKGTNDFTASAAEYLANSKMNAKGSFMWQENPNFSQNQYCIYEGITFGAKYLFEVFARNDSNGSAHKNSLYFGYADANHYYKLLIPSDGTMQLYKKDGDGEAVLLASCDETGFDMRAGASVRINVKNGSIKVEKVVGESVSALITYEDATPLAGGKIGVGSENAVAGFRDIHACPIEE